MQSVKKLPFIFLTLLAGCTEQSSDIPRVAGPVDQSEIGNQLYKVVKIVDGDTIDVLTEDKKTIRLRFNENTATDFCVLVGKLRKIHGS